MIFGVQKLRSDLLLVWEGDPDESLRVAAAFILDGAGKMREVHLRSTDKDVRLECLRMALKAAANVSLDDGSARSVYAELGRLGIRVLDAPYGSIHELFPDVHKALWDSDACELTWKAEHVPAAPGAGFGHWDITFRIQTKQRFRYWSYYNAFDDHDPPPDHPVHFPLQSWGCTVCDDGSFRPLSNVRPSEDIVSVSVLPQRDLYCHEGPELTIRVRESRAQTSIFKENLVDFLRQAIGSRQVATYVGFGPAKPPSAGKPPAQA